MTVTAFSLAITSIAGCAPTKEYRPCIDYYVSKGILKALAPDAVYLLQLSAQDLRQKLALKRAAHPCKSAVACLQGFIECKKVSRAVTVWVPLTTLSKRNEGASLSSSVTRQR